MGPLSRSHKEPHVNIGPLGTAVNVGNPDSRIRILAPGVLLAGAITAIAMAIQSLRATALTKSSSAWTCPNSTWP